MARSTSAHEAPVSGRTGHPARSPLPASATNGCPTTVTPAPPQAAARLAALVSEACALAEERRADSTDPAVHAVAEALTAAHALLELNHDQACARRPDASGPHDDSRRVHQCGEERRESVIRAALDSIRAASGTLRFALVEEVDDRRGRGAGDH